MREVTVSYRLITFIVAMALFALARPSPATACTNFLVTKGASTDGSTMITYAVDSHTFYGELYFWPEKRHKRGAVREIVEWDTGKRLGTIPEAAQTYRVVGNMNEHQVSIGETTFGGRDELVNPEGGIDYGSMMYVALQRSKTAREAVTELGRLANEHGYRSHGESFSVSDPNEVWLMEMVGMGKGRNGAVWVARRVPDGYFTAHANQSRIRQFPLNDPDNCLHSKNVISFAREKGYFDGPDEEFSFSDAYSPADYGALRFCEARVWAAFRRVAPSLDLPSDYVRGVKGAQPLPLWIRPDKKLSVSDVMALMRDHFQGTEFDLSKGVGAGPYALPYRWRPLVWKHRGKAYFNERATSTQQTGMSFVSQSRSWLPDSIGGVHWFGVDDTGSTVYVPMYMGMSKAPPSYAQGTGSFTKFSWSSAFWVFNHVSNLAYLRYRDMIADVQKVQSELEQGFLRDQPEVEAKALALHKRSPAAARRYLTDYSTKVGEATVARYQKLGPELLVKYLDGNVRDENGKVTHPGYPEEWYQRIIDESGDFYRMKQVGESEEIEGDAPVGWWEEGPSGKAPPPRCRPCACPH